MKGIKCHNEGCNFEDKDALLEEWVNKPCPTCNEIIMSEQDFSILEGINNFASKIPGFKEMQEALLSGIGGDINSISLDNIFGAFGAPSKEYVEQYNKDIDEAVDRVKNGEFTTQEELESELAGDTPKRKRTRRGRGGASKGQNTQSK